MSLWITPWRWAYFGTTAEPWGPYLPKPLMADALLDAVGVLVPLPE
jgi:hypothetical protein